MDLCNSLALLCCWCCDRKDPDEEQQDHEERLAKASQIKPFTEQPDAVSQPAKGPTKLQQTVEVQRDQEDRCQGPRERNDGDDFSRGAAQPPG